MRSSRRSRIAAVVLFALTCVVVVGGMAWATVATYKLAKDEHLSQLRVAIWRMENHIGGILAAEKTRPYTDYIAFHTTEPAAVWSNDGRVHDAVLAVLPSPIRASGPPHDWIELYFQVDGRGRFTSPQLPDETTAWATELQSSHAVPEERADSMLQWLTSVLTVQQLEDRVANAPRRDHPALAARSVDHAHAAHRLGEGVESPPGAPSSEYQRRARSKITTQRGASPETECVPEDIADANIRNITGDARGLVDLTSPVMAIEVSEAPWATFWLDSKECGCGKMAFVRTVYREVTRPGREGGGSSVFYQGFIGDWNRLKPELLAQITDLFPDADLLPVPDDTPPNPETSETEMSAVPVRMSVPEMTGGPGGAAWRSVRWMLATAWFVAGTVLLVAGWGIRNLVALTERRIQFAYAVTHELRTPLTTFRLYSDMLSAGLVPEESKQQYLDTLNRESLRLSNLVKGVLEYARLENQKPRLNPVPADGATLLRTITEGLETQCQENGIEAFARNTISDGQSLMIDLDAVQQIAGVLIHNACRHTRGAESPVVQVHLSSDNGKLNLDVIDSGPGIDRADARTIFKPFRRGHKADAAARGGIGLGLALARSWASLLEGRLELAARHHPELGGAHFRLTIPTQLRT